MARDTAPRRHQNQSQGGLPIFSHSIRTYCTYVGYKSQALLLYTYVRIQVSGIITLHFYVNVRILYKSQVLLLYTYVNII